MKKSFKNRQANKMADITKMLADSSINLAKIAQAKESGALTPELAQAEQKLLTMQDILGDIIVADTEFAMARQQNRGPAWRHFLLGLILLGGMLGGARGVHRQHELGSTQNTPILLTITLALGGLATYHGKRACDFQIEYHNACAEYLKKYQDIMKRAQDLEKDINQKVK
ncbi:hypothetical protein HDR63_04360 [bacterium]|nr:hypothetical protein [bacterium]